MIDNINIDLILSKIEYSSSIKYNDGTIDELKYIKRNISKLNSLYSNLTQDYVYSDIEKLKKTIKNQKIKLLKNLKNIDLIYFPYINYNMIIKLNNGILHNEKGPSVIFTSYGKIIKKLYFINDKEITEKQWKFKNRLSKIKKIINNE